MAPHVRLHLTHFVLILRFQLKSPQRIRLKSHPHPTFSALHNLLKVKKKEKAKKMERLLQFDQERRLLIIAEIDSQLGCDFDQSNIVADH